MTRFDPRLWKVFVAGAAFALSVGCAHPGTPSAAGRAAADMAAAAANAERALVPPKSALGQVDLGDGHRALALSKWYFWARKPDSIVTLSRPVKLPFAFWGVVADRTVVLVHADTGQSLSPRGFDPFPKEWMASR